MHSERYSHHASPVPPGGSPRYTLHLCRPLHLLSITETTYPYQVHTYSIPLFPLESQRRQKQSYNPASALNSSTASPYPNSLLSTWKPCLCASELS